MTPNPRDTHNMRICNSFCHFQLQNGLRPRPKLARFQTNNLLQILIEFLQILRETRRANGSMPKSGDPKSAH